MRYLYTCFKKLFSSLSFWLSIVAITLICMTSELYLNPQTLSSESIFYVFRNYSKDALLTDVHFSSFEVFKVGLGSWTKLFATVLVSIAVVNIKLDEQTSGAFRFVVPRVGKTKYNIGSYLFYLISAGFTLVLGYLLFGIIIYFMFPSLSQYPQENIQYILDTSFGVGSMMEQLYKFGGVNFVILGSFLQLFFYGMLCVIASMLMSTFVENKYVIICTPFFLKYSVDRFSAFLYEISYSDSNNTNELISKIASIINVDSTLTVLSYKENMNEIIVFYLVFILLSGIVFFLLNNRRCRYV